MKNKTLIIIGLIVAICLIILSYFLINKFSNEDETKIIIKTHKIDVNKYHYLNLDKIILMVKNDEKNNNINHYLSLDLAIRSDDKHLKQVKNDLPLLKSLAVNYLSKIVFDDLKNINIEELADKLQEEFFLSYINQHNLAPFDKIMISRFIVE